ncbi:MULTISPECIES: PcfJ domain-containing protein [Alicyclobacillus]|uniref:PcfJ domain-containing protein n=1 Tax=Alicyclobacillus acidoterrestris (strain ATCC 49025 / DSM 3922 / CIP 106132 / NCIMB 13137 / GD3B) TaxID=1356854 RepID=T0BUU8_ALIAG|nr:MULTISPECIES: PcfJ domain-containing protein [Alicyclobacillus]EPZ47868.1 hypothetical protein N007_04730 [Alicyclobacillus acidoterrestris ATCC 49025]UNO51065.1 PcfJ domain-containing protein [Alicyclobacillus acidoterrestris]GEO28104.1 hypothetical protein AAC03nite_38890 [Alicyclobacillus acidoterrestris]
MEFNEAIKHFPKKISKSLCNYARDTVFKESRYLFVWRVGKVQMAYCTHCKVEYPLGLGGAYFKHNEKTDCLNCHSKCTVKQNGRGRSRLVDYAYIVWYEKSRLNKNVVVARAFYAQRDYSGDYRETETQFTTCAWYVFEPGRGGTEFRNEWNGKTRKMRNVGSYVEQRMYNYYFGIIKPAFCSTGSIKRAVKGTPLQYSMWQEYDDETFDFVKFFNIAAKYPCVEYLTKMGLKTLVSAKMLGHQTYRAIYWRGKNPQQVLRMPKTDILRLLELPNVLPKTLHSYHFWRKQGFEVTPEQAFSLQDITEDRIWQYLTEKKIAEPIMVAKYILKQMRREDAPERYSRATSVLIDWQDTLRMSKELGMDLGAPHVLFPTSLRQTHDKLMQRVKIKRDEEINRRIALRVQELMCYAYSDDRFFIRPAKSSNELFEEGKTLNHCVGGYSDQYASGICDLYVLRSVTEPEKPFVTVEVSDNAIRQARGYKNCDPQPEVKEFLKRFARLLKKESKQRNKPKSRVA